MGFPYSGYLSVPNFMVIQAVANTSLPFTAANLGLKKCY